MHLLKVFEVGKEMESCITLWWEGTNRSYNCAHFQDLHGIAEKLEQKTGTYRQRFTSFPTCDQCEPLGLDCHSRLLNMFFYVPLWDTSKHVVEKWWLSSLLLSSRYRLSRHQCMRWAHKPLQSQWREGESAATRTPTNVNGKLQILVANTMGSGNNIAQPHDGGTMMVWRSIAHHLSIHGWHYSNLHELACSRHCLL